MENIFKQLKLFIEYIIVRFLFIFLSLLPIDLVSTLGGFTLRLFGPLSRSHKIAKSNLEKIFYNLKEDDIKMKINKTEISRILHTFERFNYTVLASYPNQSLHSHF